MQSYIIINQLLYNENKEWPRTRTGRRGGTPPAPRPLCSMAAHIERAIFR